MTATVAIVGAGLAGFQVASVLRDQNFQGRVVLIGDEAHRPYHRPPLSKAYLLSTSDEASVAMRPDAYYADRKIEVLSSTRAVSIDRNHRKLALDNGSVIDYEHLVLAVGARNRPLHVPGYDLNGVFFLRHLDEARALRVRLHKAKQAVVVGAGFIGLEFAAAALKLQVAVTVLEVADRPMSRALSAPMSAVFAREHEKSGMRFMFNTQLKRLIEDEGRVAGVETVDGGDRGRSRIDRHWSHSQRGTRGDLQPRDPQRRGGRRAPCDGGSAYQRRRRLCLVSQRLCRRRVRASGIGAKRHRSGALRGRSDTGSNTAAVLRRPVVLERPSASEAADSGSDHEPRPDRHARRPGEHFVFCVRKGRLLGVETVNRPADHMAARRLIGNHTALSPAQAADESVDLKAIAAAAAAGANP